MLKETMEACYMKKDTCTSYSNPLEVGMSRGTRQGRKFMQGIILRVDLYGHKL